LSPHPFIPFIERGRADGIGSATRPAKIMLALPILLLLSAIASLSVSCLEMQPTFPGIPATPKPFVCPAILAPTSLTACMDAATSNCGPANIEPLKISCPSGIMYAKAGAFEQAGFPSPFTCDTVRETWTDSTGQPLSAIGFPANTQIYVACIL
ncbi:hypothetical protein PENTCL1PPCAC_19584, partial [Pristionchus entomophagus]